MDTFVHTLNTLFDQLGLPSSDPEIDQFIRDHRKLSAHVSLHSAPFWSPNQSRFIKEALDQDSDWAELVDDLNTRLHS
jgi:hypothetical protein